MQKIKISFLIPVLKGGGAERNIINLVTNLDRDKYHVSIIAGNIAEDFKDIFVSDISIINLHCRNIINLFFKLKKHLLINKPEILVSALPHINTLSLMAKSFFKINTKIVLTEHTTFSLLSSTARSFFRRFIAKFILPLLMRIFYPKAQAIICVSEGVKEDLSSVVGSLRTMRVIYNPVVDENIYLLAKESLERDGQIFDKKVSIIIAVGRLVKAKDYPNLFKAFKIVKDNIEVHLVILGEGPEEKSLKKLSFDLGISSNISFLGFKKNPYKYMANSSVFVLSSSREGFGNVIVEAMACGVPVIATDCKSGPKEIIENNINGILVSQKDESALADAILKVLKDSDLAKKLSVQGRKRAEYFSIKKSATSYSDVFQQI